MTSGPCVNPIKNDTKPIKTATKCKHTDKPHYSGGLCQICYLAEYYKKRKQKRLEKQR